MAGSWLVRHARARPDPAGRVRLVCLPYAGGGSSVFAAWPPLLPPEVELYAVQLPGRESRILQRPLADLDSVLAGVGPMVAELTDRPLALFGHSMGALVAFELCRWLRARRLPAPVRLFASGRRAPHLPHDRPRLHHLPDESLLNRLREFNGTPPEVLGDLRVMSLLLPTLRADLAVNDDYRHRDDDPLDLPISAYGGSADPHVDIGGLLAWRRHTRAGFDVKLFRGDHFFVHTARADLVGAVGSALATCLV